MATTDPSSRTAPDGWLDAAAYYVAGLGRTPVAVPNAQPELLGTLADLGVPTAELSTAALAVLVLPEPADWSPAVLAQAGVDTLVLGAPPAVAEWVATAAADGAVRIDAVPQTPFGAALVSWGALPLDELVGRYEQWLLEVAALRAEVTRLRHDELTRRDHAIGSEAAVGTLRRRLAEAENTNDELRDFINEIYLSRTWRLGNRVVGPIYRLSRAAAPVRPVATEKSDE